MILTIFVLTACSQGEMASRYARRDLEQYQQDKSVLQYFLSDIPEWMNMSQSGQCKKDITVKNIDYKTLRTSFSLEYEQAVQFQYMYNVEYWRLRKKYKSDYLTFLDESVLFHQTMDKIMAGIKLFTPPEYKQISLLWVDPLIQKNNLSKLKQIFASEKFHRGHPVFISFCMSLDELNSFITTNGLDAKNIRLITHEMLSIYKDDNTTSFELTINLSKIFAPEQKLSLFLPTSDIPPELDGTFVIEKY